MTGRERSREPELVSDLADRADGITRNRPAAAFIVSGIQRVRSEWNFEVLPASNGCFGTLEKARNFKPIRSSPKSGPGESFGEYRAQESRYVPTPQMRGGEVATGNP